MDTLPSMYEYFKSVWVRETTALCKIETWRDSEGKNEAQVRSNLRQCQAYFQEQVDEVNESLPDHKLNFFQWCGNEDEDHNVTGIMNPPESVIDEHSFWIFGYRVGPDTADFKLTLVCHLDTVPGAKTEDGSWDPFNPHKEYDVEYESINSEKQDFLIGRGCIDDKGPAVSAFAVARHLAKELNSKDVFERTQLEIIFDTSEETNMSTPKFWLDPQTRNPDFGIVYDAMWCVRAEKGGERPVFRTPIMEPVGSGLTLHSMISSPANSANTIPDWAQAVIRGSESHLTAFQAVIEKDFKEFVYPDAENYERGVLQVVSEEENGHPVIKLTIDVVGAQHGSAPDENLRDGVNPLVSLANFIAGISAEGYSEHYKFKDNHWVRMAKFMAWMWGTKVFGEHHKRLVAHDDVFTEANGTTYAVTKTSIEKSEDESEVLGAKLEIDIRYAMDHHENPWDGVTEGFLEGLNSKFGDIFSDLTHHYNHKSGSNVTYGGVNTLFAPDIRVPDTNENYLKAEAAFRDVIGFDPPRLAIGGGTDAKGNTSVLGLGPLFSTSMGPPINYHGIGEGAPIDDMMSSTVIMYRLCYLELTEPSAARLSTRVKERKKKSMEKMYRMMASKHTAIRCNH